ncbi:step II splicing factor slu7 [Histomonas meleagridis]|uniref:step II splicing factor slu7 n=1 Tax=Histomonas meleagridis TaxID=135588 RepID=UPI00355AB91B|nr:step II splicing factor slu7 [Histomonas meleagridis]KAH0796247.1 step II splicing factor slu7 [Histomonas meleagridis]
MDEYELPKLRDEGDISGANLPQYIKKSPWYYKTEEGDLSYLRIAPYAAQKKTDLSEFYEHGSSNRRVAVKWKPGCCKNCGSSTHTEFECTERPRKRNARVMTHSIASEEKIEKHDLNYAAKRDNYSNYSSQKWWHDVRNSYSYAQRVSSGAQQPIETSNPIQPKYGNSGFRNRQDIARYIAVIGTNKPVAPENDDIFVKPGGKSNEKEFQGLMAWEGYELNTNKPKEKKEERAIEQQHYRNFYESKEILARSANNEIVEIVEAPIPKSEKYGDEEDKFTNGHTAVYGSYFDNGKWGYACCRQTDKNCFCTNANPVDA